MKADKSYEAINARKNEIIKNAMQIDYEQFELPGIGFDYERMMKEAGYSMEEMQKIQLDHGVGNTPLIELKNLTALSRKYAPKGKGARIVVKDEAAMRKSLDTKALSLPLPETMVQQLHLRRPCRD